MGIYHVAFARLPDDGGERPVHLAGFGGLLLDESTVKIFSGVLLLLGFCHATVFAGGGVYLFLPTGRQTYKVPLVQRSRYNNVKNWIVFNIVIYVSSFPLYFPYTVILI